MKLQLSFIAAAILMMSLTITVADKAMAEAVKPTAQEIKLAVTGSVYDRFNSKGNPMTFKFKAGGVLEHENHVGTVREGKWRVIGDSPAPTYDKEIAEIRADDAMFCYDFLRARRDDIRRVCSKMEKDGNKIYRMNARNTGKRVHFFEINK